MYDDVRKKLKKKNKILFTGDSKCLQELIAMIEAQPKAAVVKWAFTCAQTIIPILEERFPNDKRPRTAYDLSARWMKGEVKMPVAKQAILACHSAAKEISDEYYIALFHAVAQGLSAIHVKIHALGLVFYELTAIAIKYYPDFEEKIAEKIADYLNILKQEQVVL